MPNRSFRQKIDKVQEITGLTPTAMEKKSGLGQGTLTKNYEKNKEMSSSSTTIFLSGMGLNREWWESGTGDIYVKNTTQEIKSNSSPEMEQFEAYRTLVEGKTPYILQHSSIIEQYRMVPHEIIKMLYQNSTDKASLEEKYERLIRELKEENELLRKKLPPEPTA